MPVFNSKQMMSKDSILSECDITGQPASTINQDKPKSKTCKRKEAGPANGAQVIDKYASKKSCQRRLFVCEDSENIPNRLQTTTEMLHFLLGDSGLFTEYQKFRKLSRMHPADKSFKQCYDSVLARVQTTVSKIQNDAGKNPLQMKEKKKVCEQLMLHWGMYYF
ncbi:uncharacterized protein LOC134273584 [Saccostrea cucullata]|uniref:uncharacterized protein LOC134273584 n=1 Tax=Saccostrea cuccullata TaxID=36930 RepID=UPI002ED39FD9